MTDRKMSSIVKKRLIMIGRSFAGKTTLCQSMNGETLKYRKTQAVELVCDNMIDTPGEYFEQRRFWGALTVTAMDADIILLVQEATEDGTMFPPGYGSGFSRPAVGIVTKCDLASEKQIRDAESCLEMAGAQKIFRVSNVTGKGIKELTDYLSRL